MTPVGRRTTDSAQRVPSMLWWQDTASCADIEIRWEIVEQIHRAVRPGLLAGFTGNNAAGGEFHVWEYIDLPPTMATASAVVATNWESLTNLATGLPPVGIFVPSGWSHEQAVLAMESAASVLPETSLLLRMTESGLVRTWSRNKVTGELKVLPLEFDPDPATLVSDGYEPFRPLNIAAGSGAAAAMEREEAPATATPALAASAPVVAALPPTVVRLEVPKWVWAGVMFMGVSLIAVTAWFVLLREPKTANQADAPPRRERIDLEVRRGGEGGLDVRWDGVAAMRLGAQTGTLRIVDGGQLTEVPLTALDLQSGKLLYVPRSGNVEVLLSVSTSAGPIQEAVRVIGGAQVQAVKPPVRAPVPAAPQQSAPGAPAEPQVSRDRAAPAPTRQVFTAVEATQTQTAAPALAAPPPAVVAQDTTAQPALRLDRIPEPPATRTEPAKQTTPPQVQSQPQQQQPNPAQLPARNPVVIPPRPVHQVMPMIPPHLKQVMPQTTVITVRLTIDAQGKVVDAQTEAASGLMSHLSRLARDAGRQWRFDPATLDGRVVQAEHVIHFKFGK